MVGCIDQSGTTDVVDTLYHWFGRWHWRCDIGNWRRELGMAWHGSDSCFLGYCAYDCWGGSSHYFSHYKVRRFEEEEQSTGRSKDDADLLCVYLGHPNRTQPTLTMVVDS